MTTRLPDAYFDRMYAASADPWQLQERWYERRKFAITLACCRIRATGTHSSPDVRWGY